MAANGSMWIESNYLYWRDSANTRFRFLGTRVGSPAGATSGSIWVEANNVHYIDSSGVERYASGAPIQLQTGTAGSVWIDPSYAPSGSNGQFHFLGQTQHEHWLHTDTAFVNSHTDTAFSSAHTDAHTNSHTNIGYTNAHNDAHYNTHTDAYNHNDAFDPLGHYDFTDNYFGHSDAHTDNHTDVGGAQSHTNTHSNAHTNIAFGNSHSDVAHIDKPESV